MDLLAHLTLFVYLDLASNHYVLLVIMQYKVLIVIKMLVLLILTVYQVLVTKDSVHLVMILC
jgi:hypothetical protein